MEAKKCFEIVSRGDRSAGGECSQGKAPKPVQSCPVLLESLRESKKGLFIFFFIGDKKILREVFIFVRP